MSDKKTENIKLFFEAIINLRLTEEEIYKFNEIVKLKKKFNIDGSVLEDKYDNIISNSKLTKLQSMEEAIEIIRRLVVTVRYTIHRSNGLNEAYHNAKEFLELYKPAEADSTI